MATLPTLVGASPVNADDGTYATFASNSASQTLSYALADTPTDFDTMTTLSWTVVYSLTVARANDTFALGIRIMNGATVLAAANSGGGFVTINSNITNTTDATAGPTAFAYVNTTATKADWDGASIELQSNVTKQAGWDAATIRVDYAAVTGTYAVFTATVPSAITTLSATPGNGQVTLNWTAPSNGGSAITDYEYRVDGGTWTSTGSTSASTVVGGLTNGTSYDFEVRAINAVGAAATSNVATATPSTVPSAITDLAGTAGDTQVTLNWTAPSNGGSAITDYEYRVDAGTWTSTGSTSPTKVVTGLTNGVSYDFEVRAVNANGAAATSNVETVSPVAPPAGPVIESYSSGADTTQSGTVSAFTVTKPAGLADGDTAVIFAHQILYNPGASLTWTPPTGFTQILADTDDSSGAYHIAIFAKDITDAAGEGTWTCTPVDGTPEESGWAFAAIRLSGTSLAKLSAYGIDQSTSTTDHPAPSATIPSDNAKIIAGAAGARNATWTSPSGFTELVDVQTSGAAGTYAEGSLTVAESDSLYGTADSPVSPGIFVSSNARPGVSFTLVAEYFDPLAINLVQQAYNAGSSEYADWPSAPTVGNLLVCIQGGRADSDAGTPTFTPPTGFTEILELSPMEFHSASISWKVADGSEAARVYIDPSIGIYSPLVALLEFDLTNPSVDVFAQLGSGATSVSSIASGSTGTLNSANCLGIFLGTSRTATENLSLSVGTSIYEVDAGSANWIVGWEYLTSNTALNLTVSESSGASRMGSAVVVFETAPTIPAALTDIPWYTAAWAGDDSAGFIDNTAVSLWPDISGNGRDFEQVNSSRQPLFISSATELNGKPALQFDGTDDTIAYTLPSDITHPMSVVIVAYTYSDSNDYEYVSANNMGLSIDNTGSHGLRLWGPSATIIPWTTSLRDTTSLLVGVYTTSGNKWRVNENEGTTATVNSSGNWAGYINVGGYQSGGFCTHIRVGFIGVYEGDITQDAGYDAFLSWVTTEYGVTTVPPADTDPFGLTWKVLGWPADPLHTPPSDGNPISSWRDASGNGYTFTAQGGKEPTYKAASTNMNGKPAWSADGTEALGSSTFANYSQYTLIGVVYVNPSQAATLGYLVSGYDTMIRMDGSTNAEVYAWGSSTATDILAGDIRGELHLFMAYFDGANSKWRVDDQTGTAPLMAGGNNFLTRLTAGAWDGNVSGESINGEWGLIGAAQGDVTNDPGFLGWITNEFGITTGYGGGALTLPVLFGSSQVQALYAGSNQAQKIYHGSTQLWP